MNLSPSPKKEVINEAGDRYQGRRASDSPNDLLELTDDEVVLVPEAEHKVRELSCKGKPTAPPLSRSDMSYNWRNEEFLIQRIIVPQASETRKYGPPKKPFQLQGPDDEKIAQLLKRTGYKLAISPRQRTYGSPPPGWSGPAPSNHCQVFVGKIPKQIFEDKLVPVFETVGTIYEMRIMMEGAPSVISRGYGFVVYATPEQAKKAEQELDDYEILAGYKLKVAVSDPICRLFLCQIPKHLTEQQVEDEVFSKLSHVTSIDYKAFKGYCFVNFKDHISTALAKKLISNGSIKLLGGKISVDFADQMPEPDETAMSKVKTVHVTGFRPWTTEAELEKTFGTCGLIEDIKKFTNYAFIYFEQRSAAEKAIDLFHNQLHNRCKYQVTLAKPPVPREAKEEAIIRRTKRHENQRKGSLGGKSQAAAVPALIRTPGKEVQSSEGQVLVVENGRVFLDGKRVFVQLN